MLQLIRALRIMMKHNVFKFGDTYYLQKDSTTIRSIPASDWTTIIFNFYEIAIIGPTFRANLRLDIRFIDDKIDVWRPLQHNDYNNFASKINKMCELD